MQRLTFHKHPRASSHRKFNHFVMVVYNFKTIPVVPSSKDFIGE
jgi:hypothetical protein